MLFLSVIVAVVIFLLASYISLIVYRSEISGLKSPRSQCDICSEPLKWYELIPIFSYLFQLGKCRKCKKYISPRYFLVEVFGLIVALLSVVLLNSEISALLKVFFFVQFFILYVLAIWDLWTFSIPKNLTNIFALFSLLIFIYQIITNDFLGTYGSLLSNLLTAVIATLFLYSLKYFFKDEGLGIGDIVLVAAISLSIGSTATLAFYYVAVFSALLFAIVLFSFTNKLKGMRIPMVPFITMAFLVSIIWGEQIYFILFNQI